MINDKLANRKNLTYQWEPPDSEDSYRSIQKNGDINYLPTDFNYSYNSHGFRCDEFDVESDVRILFLGCSITEGIGLPVDHLWTSHILNNIKTLPQYKHKKVAYWNLAIGGTGTDTTARVLSEHIDLIKPTIIIYLICSVSRREYKENTKLLSWIPAYNKTKSRELEMVFCDEDFANYQSYRSLLLIEWISKAVSASLYIFTMQGNDNFVDQYSGSKIHKLDQIKLTNIHVPDEFKVPCMARDDAHGGPNWQYVTYLKIWDTIKHEFDK